MRESIGSTFMYNIIIVFLLIVFALIAGTLSYYKAFRVNTFITDAIEKYEGFNSLSIAEIDKSLNNIGYKVEPQFKCLKRRGANALPKSSGVRHKYCVYLYNEGSEYRTYGVVSYINIELPIIGEFLGIPIYSQTIRLYNFKK